MTTLKDTLREMEESNLVIDRALPSGDSYLIEFKEGVKRDGSGEGV